MANGYRHIEQEEAKLLMDNEDGYALLDVRTQAEFAGGHIPGAICLPNEEITAQKAARVLPQPGQLLLVYCRSGARSRQAAHKLAMLGYTDVRDFGGVDTWPYGLVK